MIAASYISGENSPPLLEVTIGAALEGAAQRYGSRMALVSRQQSVRWTWEDLNARADALISADRAFGLVPGLIWVNPGTEALIELLMRG